MAPPTVIEREAPAVVTHTHAATRRSRLPSAVRFPILVVLNMGISALLREYTQNFLAPELGAVSKVPTPHDDIFSLYSAAARALMRVVTIWITWYLNYDFVDVAALTVLTQAPYFYLLSTYYQISTLTIAAHLNIEVLSFAIPAYLLRARSVVHKKNAPLRNRYLINSVQVQLSSTFLATGVYVVVLWAGLKTGALNRFLVRHFSVETFAYSHLETPVSAAGKIFALGVAVKEFLLNPSIAAEPPNGAASPTETFDAAIATLPQTVKHNVWRFDRRTRTLVIQTLILNAFVFGTTVQKAMTLKGTEVVGAAGYAGMWVLANSVVALWFGWIGDTSADYEPL
ncbi:hypothetical protein T440DRAFT_555386 [Plenodomus tracheiphilus IPT5]|uniref:Uncharacterized protein n=1 Tax=Plenodomus tracheiphilus IPT5 TaxID=1408161 RepID=A0A6A7B3M3_9PLEO|nr:hypothetical protein T440DRAFT_555386 [Plenodomus tracheiphilus IPT5]